MEIRPGAVKQARQEAKLSLAGVADGQLTRAAIHLIETGRSRPSMPTLELIARRTGKPISYFLSEATPEGGSAQSRQVDEVELTVERGDYTAAIELATPLLGTTNRWNLARLHHSIGQAHARLVQSAPALDHLRIARAIAEELADPWLVVECMDWEAAALTVAQDPAALEVAEDALIRCRALDPVPPGTEARILSRIASFHLLSHDWEKAVHFYEAALKASGPLRDLGRMARLQQGLSLAYDNLGDSTRAISYAHKALALHSMLQDRASMAVSQNNLGLALMKQGDLAGAHRSLSAALESAQEARLDQMKSHVLLSLAELEMARGAFEEAQALLVEAAGLADRLGEHLNLGVVAMLEGRIAAEHQRAGQADRSFAAALRIFEDLGARERLIECHSAYADVLEARGATKLALEQTKLALAASRPALARPEQTARQAGQAG